MSFPSLRSFLHTKRGFSLIELLVSISIIAIIASVIMIRFSYFDSSVLLKSLAYEIATTLRESQVYAVSVLGTDSADFRRPYGVTFSPGTKSYTLFQYGGISPIPRYNAAASDVEVFTIGRSMSVTDVCVRLNSGTENCGITRLDISFRRPEFEAIFFTPEIASGNIATGIIKVTGASGVDVWRIEVGVLGQISVIRE